MGGGVILTIFLGLFLSISQSKAQATNLTFFIPTSLIAIIMNAKQKNIDYKTGIIIAISGIIGAIIGANFAMGSKDNLRKYFAIFILIIAILETYAYIKSLKGKKNK